MMLKDLPENYAIGDDDPSIAFPINPTILETLLSNAMTLFLTNGEDRMLTESEAFRKLNAMDAIGYRLPIDLGAK